MILKKKIIVSLFFISISLILITLFTNAIFNGSVFMRTDSKYESYLGADTVAALTILETKITNYHKANPKKSEVDILQNTEINNLNASAMTLYNRDINENSSKFGFTSNLVDMNLTMAGITYGSYKVLRISPSGSGPVAKILNMFSGLDKKMSTFIDAKEIIGSAEHDSKTSDFTKIRISPFAIASSRIGDAGSFFYILIHEGFGHEVAEGVDSIWNLEMPTSESTHRVVADIDGSETVYSKNGYFSHEALAYYLQMVASFKMLRDQSGLLNVDSLSSLKNSWNLVSQMLPSVVDMLSRFIKGNNIQFAIHDGHVYAEDKVTQGRFDLGTVDSFKQSLSFTDVVFGGVIKDVTAINTLNNLLQPRIKALAGMTISMVQHADSMMGEIDVQLNKVLDEVTSPEEKNIISSVKNSLAKNHKNLNGQFIQDLNSLKAAGINMSELKIKINSSDKALTAFENFYKKVFDPKVSNVSTNIVSKVQKILARENIQNEDIAGVNTYSANYPASKSRESQFIYTQFKIDKKGWDIRSQTVAGADLNAGKTKMTTSRSGKKPSPVKVTFSTSSSPGKIITKAHTEKPNSLGKDTIAYTEKMSKEVLSGIGVSTSNGQAVVVSNGSILLSYDYGWYLDNEGESPDFMFDSSQYLSERICSDCYSQNFPPLQNYQDSMNLTSIIFEDYYNDTNAGGTKINLQDPVDGAVSSVSVGDIVGQRTAVFTEGALISEAAKNGSASVQELNDRLTNLAEKNEKLKISIALLDDIISGKAVVDWIDGPSDNAGDIEKGPGQDSTGSLAIKAMMNTVSAILGNEKKSPSMDVNLGVPGQLGIQGSENAPSTSGTTALDQALAQAQADAETSPATDSFPDQAKAAGDYVTMITVGNNSVPTLTGVNPTTGVVTVVAPKTTADVTNMVTAIANNIKAATDAVNNAGQNNTPGALQAAYDTVVKANDANAAMTKVINDKAKADAPKESIKVTQVPDTKIVNVDMCTYGGANMPCSVAISKEDARIATYVAAVTKFVDTDIFSVYKKIKKTDISPVMYPNGPDGVYLDINSCSGQFVYPLCVKGGQMANQGKTSFGRAPNTMNNDQFNKAKEYREKQRTDFIAANTPAKAPITPAGSAQLEVTNYKEVTEIIPAVAPILITDKPVDTGPITAKINAEAQNAATQATRDASLFTTAIASSGCDVICQFFNLPQNPLSSSMSLEQAKQIIANSENSNSVSSIEAANALTSYYYTTDGFLAGSLASFPAITIDYSNSCK